MMPVDMRERSDWYNDLHGEVPGHTFKRQLVSRS
jgi:hypothetical protein